MDTSTYEVNQHSLTKAQDRIRVIISTVAAFLLSLGLVALSVLLILQWIGFSRNSFDKNMSANNYYDSVLSDIVREAESITLPIGLPGTVLEDVFTSDGISKDVNGYIDASFLGETYVAETKEMAEKLEENVRAYLEEAEIVTDANQEINLKAYIDSIMLEYTDSVQMPFLASFVKARNVYREIFTISMIAFAVFTLLCLFVLLRLHQWLYRGLRYVVYAMLATGLMLSIVPFIILQSGFYKRIHLSPEYFYNFFTDYVTNLLKSFLNLSVIWFVISGVLIVAISMLKKRKE